MTPIRSGLYEFKKENLIEIRNELGLSQSKMAKLLSIPANTLSRWETGATIPDASSLASIYSLARELGVETPNFFDMRADLPAIEISSPDINQSTIHRLYAYQGLKGYLKTHITDIGSIKSPIIKIEISNTAPDDSTLPNVVFTGVSISISSISKDIHSFLSKLKVNSTYVKRKEETEAKLTPWENDAKRKGLLNIAFQQLDNITLDNSIQSEQDQGIVLFQGESIIYEVTIPSELLPYLKFRVDGDLSWQHLFHYEETFDMPEAYTKPLAVSALNDFNKIEIHRPLLSVIESIKDYNKDPQSFDKNNFNNSLSRNIGETQTIKGSINSDFRQHLFNWFKAHIRATNIYLDIVIASFKRFEGTIGQGDTGKTAAQASMILSLKNTAYQLNHETEAIMDKLNISDTEAGYRYRHMK